MLKNKWAVVETDFQYRILQNSISRFSIYLNKADTLNDICNCLLRNTKYLYNYSYCRFHYFHQGKHVCYTINRHEAKIEQGDIFFLSEAERKVYDSSIPFYQKMETDYALSADGSMSEVWIWKFPYNDDAGMIVTIHSTGEFRFLKEQIPFVKIAGEMLYTKTRMVLLVNDLNQQQQALQQSYKKLEESNALVSTLLSQQERTIDDRTQALTRLNTKLVDLIQFNSHHIREPLTRVMGLMSLYELMSPADFFEEYWPLLEESVKDMDKTIRQVISKTEKIEKHENFPG